MSNDDNSPCVRVKVQGIHPHVAVQEGITMQTEAATGTVSVAYRDLLPVEKRKHTHRCESSYPPSACMLAAQLISQSHQGSSQASAAASLAVITSSGSEQALADISRPARSLTSAAA